VHRFDTPQPLAVDVDVPVGAVRIVAGDRQDTVVDVRPADPADRGDVFSADGTTVELSAGTLTVRAPRGWRYYSPFSTRAGSIEVTVEVPAGSRVTVDVAMGSVHTEGRLGACRLKAAMGSLTVDEADELTLKTSHGDLTVGRTGGLVDLQTGSGHIRVDRADGPLVVRNGNGVTRIGTVTGDLRVKSSSGDVEVGRAERSVAVRTASGRIRIGELVEGVADLRTAAGEIEVGVRRGTAVLLDVQSQGGRVRSELDTTDGPGDSEGTVELKARTSVGDIVIRRSADDISTGGAA
jgi:DUF4097 and DUF4098 domain-containing protein YvlB